MTGSEKLARLQRALEWGGGTHSIGDVVDLIKEGRAQLWENEAGVIVSEIEEYPQMKAVRFWLIAGELKHCLALEDDILADAIERGCTKAVAMGRKGWGRAAAPTGWVPWLPSFHKPLVAR
jgi:hypothetical protein